MGKVWENIKHNRKIQELQENHTNQKFRCPVCGFGYPYPRYSGVEAQGALGAKWGPHYTDATRILHGGYTELFLRNFNPQLLEIHPLPKSRTWTSTPWKLGFRPNPCTGYPNSRLEWFSNDFPMVCRRFS